MIWVKFKCACFGTVILKAFVIKNLQRGYIDILGAYLSYSIFSYLLKQMVKRLLCTICTKILSALCWWCFLTDIFFLFLISKDHDQKFFRYMNSRHPKIKFTCEEENDNKIFFLDISITRTENKFTTSIFRKKSLAGFI